MSEPEKSDFPKPKRWGPLEFSPTITIADLLTLIIAFVGVTAAFTRLSSVDESHDRRLSVIEAKSDKAEERALSTERRTFDRLDLLGSKLDQLIGRDSVRPLAHK